MLFLLCLFCTQTFAFAQVIVLPDTGESALPDPPEFIYVQREPSPMVAGQPYSLSWETQGGGTVTYSCTSSSGGYTIGTTTVSGKGTLSGTANAAWIGKPSNCVWRVKNAGGEDVVYEDMITIAAPLVNNAAFVSQNVPTTMRAGQSYRIQVTMQNTGNTTWLAGTWKLGPQNPIDSPRWGATRVALPGNVAPGANATFDFTVTAPTTPGITGMQWGMVQEGVAWFGATSTNVAVNVVSAKNDAACIGQSVPDTMLAGQSYQVVVTMKNTGTTTWVAGTWKLGAQNPMDTMRWGLQRVELPGNIAPNDNVTFTFNVTAPATTGPANMQWGMVQEYKEWFGAMSSTKSITVTAPPPPPPTTSDPTITVTRIGNPMTAGNTYQLSWSSTYAITVSRVCSSAGTGFASSGNLALNGNEPITASASWTGFPSDCAWTATAANGKTVTFRETVKTQGPPPTIAVTRTPNSMVAGQDFTLSWSTTNTATLTRKCTPEAAGGFVSDGAMVIDANGQGKQLATKADAAWVGKLSACKWTATAKDGQVVEFNETMKTDAAPTGPQITYIHTDGLGSPVARTDEKGVIISRTRYEPYGATAGGATPTIGFTGHVNDADTGLTYMQQRYYDPVAGRFMSVDPVLTDADTGSGFNRYVYANNSPYKYIDPDGRKTFDPYCLGGSCSNGAAFDSGDTGNPGGVARSLQPFKPYAEEMGQASKNVLGVHIVATGSLLVLVAGAEIAVGAAATETAIAVATTAKRAGDIGKEIVKWGRGQSLKDVATTTERVKQINPKEVMEMIKGGLERKWVEQQLSLYSKALEEGGKKLVNEQLVPRLELMKKILENWPKQ